MRTRPPTHSSGERMGVPDSGSTRVTELTVAPPGVRRLAHSLAYQSPTKFAWRVLRVLAELTVSQAVDAAGVLRSAKSKVCIRQDGKAAQATAGRRIAFFVHHSVSGAISALVIGQLRVYRELNFDVVFISNSAKVESEDWARASEHCWKMMRRENAGLDFGAWRDAAEWLLSDVEPPEELLLANDSVLGPLQPLDPLVQHARAQTHGLVGLTESWQGGVHLQSYFLLALGRRATSDVIKFLKLLRLSSSKWVLVQRGEFGLTRYMARRDHRVMALFGYLDTLQAVLKSMEERDYIRSLMPAKFSNGDDPEKMYSILVRWPLNPTVHLWRGLLNTRKFPFIKASVLRTRPSPVPQVSQWTELVERLDPQMPKLIQDHLES